jgi:hypothetical protein
MQQQDHRLEEYANLAFSVRQGRAIVARHRTAIERLEREGRDASSAKRLLMQYTGSLQIFEEDYSRLKEELEENC